MENNKSLNLNNKIASLVLSVSFFTLLAGLFIMDFIPLRYRIIVFLVSISFSMFVLLITKATLWRYTLAISLFIVSMGMYASKSMLDGISEVSTSEFVEYIYIENPQNDIYEDVGIIGFYGVKWSSAKAAFEETEPDYLKSDVQIYNDPSVLAYDLINNHIEGAIIQSSFVSDILLVVDDFFDTFKIVNRFKIEQAIETVEKPVNIEKDNFVIYLSGVDVYGDVLTRARTDMNMLLVVNPLEKKVMTLSIPRDTYLALACEENAMDKLTHSSLYGIQCTLDSVEQLFQIDINYYARINFSGLVELVDFLGGIEVESNYDFSTDSGYHFYKGMNQVDGNKALAFARERDHIEYGDVSRGLNHQALIKAIINKITDPSMITKLPQTAMLLQNILDTNLSSKAISSFISDKIDGKSTWNVEDYNLEGSGDMQTVHSLSSQYKYYVYWPNYDSLKLLRSLLGDFIGGK